MRAITGYVCVGEDARRAAHVLPCSVSGAVRSDLAFCVVSVGYRFLTLISNREGITSHCLGVGSRRPFEGFNIGGRNARKKKAQPAESEKMTLLVYPHPINSGMQSCPLSMTNRYYYLLYRFFTNILQLRQASSKNVST